MKKLLFSLCVAALFGGLSIAVADPAVVINTIVENAGAFDGDGNLVFGPCQGVTVTTNSNTGVITARCHWRGFPNNSGHAVHYDFFNNPFFDQGFDVPCGILGAQGLVFTNDWKETVSANGNVIFVCKYKD